MTGANIRLVGSFGPRRASHPQPGRSQAQKKVRLMTEQQRV